MVWIHSSYFFLASNNAVYIICIRRIVLYMGTEHCVQGNMYYVSAQGVEERMINVHHHHHHHVQTSFSPSRATNSETTKCRRFPHLFLLPTARLSSSRRLHHFLVPASARLSRRADDPTRQVLLDIADLPRRLDKAVSLAPSTWAGSHRHFSCWPLSRSRRLIGQAALCHWRKVLAPQKLSFILLVLNFTTN